MALFVLLLCPFDISVGIGAFVIGLGQISSFLSSAFDIGYPVSLFFFLFFFFGGGGILSLSLEYEYVRHVSITLCLRYTIYIN